MSSNQLKQLIMTALSNCKPWTEAERKTLMSNIKACATIDEACKLTSKSIGRAATSCSSYYYYQKAKGKNKDKKQQNIFVSRNSKNTTIPVITFHNGTSQKMEIIVSEKNLIVARVKDTVITIRL